MYVSRIRTTRSWLARREGREDLFIKRNCARWLRKHIKRVAALEQADLEMGLWCIGQKAEDLVKLLACALTNPEAQDYRKSLVKALGAPDDLASCVLDALNDEPLNLATTLVKELERQLIQIERQALPGRPCNLERNLKRFCEMFGLNPRESELCLVFYLMRSHKQGQDWLDSHLQVDQLPGRNHLCCILSVSLGQLNRMIAGKLTSIGILDQDHSFIRFEDAFLAYLLDPSGEVNSDKLFRKALAPDVPLSYHLLRTDEVEHVQALLRKKRQSPSHVLLYGPPGTGKTSFARALVRELAVDAYEVVKPTEERDSASAARASIMGCLNITNRGEGSVIIVDEADSLLNTATAWSMRGETHDKGWLNQLMDKPGVRMVWITNSMRGMEASVMRRFAFSLHFNMFNRRQRIQLWERVLRRHRVKRFFNAADIKALAAKHNISAGVMDIAVRKAAECYPREKAALHAGLKLSLEAHETLERGGRRTVNKERVEESYSIGGVNVDGNLEGMIERVKAYSDMLRYEPDRVAMSMNMLFHGPPGTGKSELARYLAHCLDRELMVRRASDILNPYVGMTERNLAAIFDEAEREEAVLVLDEADSLLFSRDRAVRSWEISFTNEFLTQMERFRGILICTTNRLTDLDAASLRRFQDKIGFDYLTPDGNVIFYKRLLAPLAAGKLDAASKEKLRGLTNLAPGDFKVVRDRNLLSNASHRYPYDLVAQLVEETKVKAIYNGAKVMGF